MNVRSRFIRLAAMAVVVALPLLATSGVASAKATPKVCAKHPGRAKCATGGGTSTGGGTGGPSPQITVTVDPNPLVQVGQSEESAVVQVETSPSYAGDAVNIDSSQLSASCAKLGFETMQTTGPPTVPPGLRFGRDNITVILDDDGNATVTLIGEVCAPGSSVVEADLEVAPFLTALTTLVVLPPAVTPTGVTGYPQIAGTAQEVETGDTTTSGDSDIYALFYVETSSVYAEQLVSIASPQLEARCIGGWIWDATNPGVTGVGTPHLGASGTGVNPNPVSAFLDDDGNAVFLFYGASCAAGTSEVIADVLAGDHPTYISEFTVDPPAPTI